jgi:colanic acid/amylovoran biosynthesis glycosyltransferase
MTSTTFIRREIEALEDLGLSIKRFGIRTWAGQLVDPRDIAEKQRTKYLLTGNVGGLFVALTKEMFVNPRGLYRSLGLWRQLLRNSNGEFIRHVAYLMQAASFHQLAQFNRIDHVHVHFATNATTVAMLSHVMGGPSFSFTVHGPDEFVDPKRLSLDIKIRHAAFVVAISNFCKQQLLQFAPPDHPEKVQIARCGLALEEFDVSRDYETNNQTLVCVGRLCPQKGQILIPKAAAALRREFPKLKVILVGDGESRRAIEASITTYNVTDVVELRGWTANRDVLALVRDSRALLLPSYAEGLPVVIMEALALGRPVISTIIAGIPELVDDSCGWLFQAGDEDELIAAIRASLTCSPLELAQKGATGRARVEQLHDRRELAKSLYRSFQGAVARSSR